MKILGIDLGKNNSYWVFCHDLTEVNKGNVVSNCAALSQLIQSLAPDRLVIEASSSAGWVVDLARQRKIEIAVANCNDERWHWKNVKSKCD